jgi:uncharacterized protein (DUF427 family)
LPRAPSAGRSRIQTYADRIGIRQDGAVVAEHRRRYSRGETIYDPWHYVPVLAGPAPRLVGLLCTFRII